MPSKQIKFRGRKENVFQLISVNGNFKKKEILKSLLLPDHPAGATLYVKKLIAGSVITTN